MNREDIIRMAQEAWLSDKEAQFITEFDEAYISCTYLEDLEKFAALVASAEREACAEVCKKHADVYAKLEQNPTAQSAWAACIDNRDAIRARGNVATNDTSQERVDETTKQRHDAPPQRTWVGLTDDEINSVRYKRDWTAPWTDMTFARAIEAALRSKNT